MKFLQNNFLNIDCANNQKFIYRGHRGPERQTDIENKEALTGVDNTNELEGVTAQKAAEKAKVTADNAVDGARKHVDQYVKPDDTSEATKGVEKNEREQKYALETPHNQRMAEYAKEGATFMASLPKAATSTAEVSGGANVGGAGAEQGSGDDELDSSFMMA